MKDALEGVKVGDTLYRFDQNGRRLGIPDGGQPVTVVKVGRKLITTDERFGNQYRIETGVINDGYGHAWLRTKEHVDRDNARAAAVRFLSTLGLNVDYGRKPSDARLIEIADRLKDLEPER